LDRQPPRELKNAAPGKLHHHLVMPHPLPAFDEAEIPDQTILAAAHSSQPAIPKTPHGASMHCETIPSILDESSEALQRVRILLGEAPSRNLFASPCPASHFAAI